MKITRIKKRNRMLVFIISAIIFLAVLITCYFILNNNHKQTPLTPQKTPSTSETDDNPKTTEPSTDNNVDTKPNAPLNPKPAEDSNGDERSAGVSVSRTSQSNSLFSIGTLIDVVTNEGSCTLTMTKGSAVVTKTASVQAGPSSSTCAGFDIPLAELSSGTWTLNIVFENSEYKGKTSEQVTVK